MVSYHVLTASEFLEEIKSFEPVEGAKISEDLDFSRSNTGKINY